MGVSASRYFLFSQVAASVLYTAAICTALDYDSPAFRAKYRFKPPFGNSSEPMTPKEMTISCVKAVYYYLSVPKPFVLLKKSQIPVVPQMLVWYVLLLFCFPVGVLHLARHYYRESGIILICILLFTVAMALFTGNEGTAFRQRDMLIPFYFIPISVGLVNLSGWLASKLNGRDNRLQSLGD